MRVSVCRTLHTAEAAEDPKCVTQQWVACGVGAAAAAAGAPAGGAGVEELLGARRGKAGKSKTPEGKGFGAR
jgi:hypothetical protein